MATDPCLPEAIREALGQRAEEEGRSMHAVDVRAVERHLVEEADRATVRELEATYAVRHADPLRRPGSGAGEAPDVPARPGPG